VYESFLSNFPLCYGFWNKYADFEKKLGNADRARAVYERGLSVFPHSVDIWAHYCTFVAERSENLAEIRQCVHDACVVGSVCGLHLLISGSVVRLFERALSLVGNDALSGNIVWDKLIEFETSQEEFGRVAAVYARVLAVPLQVVTHYWERCVLVFLSRPRSFARLRSAVC
jgi:pre-mRNA-processing factor 39